MASKLNILVCDMETTMQDSAKHVRNIDKFTLLVVDYYGSFWKS